MTKDQVLNRIRIKVGTCNGQKGAAAYYDVSPQHLCDVLAGKREIGPKMLRGMKLERIVTYKESRA